MEKYLKMQKEYYNDERISSEQVVGNYKWHENFPYETQLLYKNGDMRMPLITNSKEKYALDFGCGPGRMINRMSKLFKRVDGVDISENLLIESKQQHPDSNFYISSGKDTGSAPNDTYDFVYSTIAMQHIAVHSIRMDILKRIHKILKPGGVATIQMAFNAEYPYIIKRKDFKIKDFYIKIFKKQKIHAAWSEDRTNATSTNSGCDVAINKDDLEKLKSDFSSIFKNVDYWFYDVSLIYQNLNGERHAPKYWPTHWIFIHGTK